MRCFFMRNGHIGSVEILPDHLTDEQAIAHAGKRFIVRLREGFEGFEVWDHERRVFRYPEGDITDPEANGGDGKPDGKPLNGGSKKKSREAQLALHLYRYGEATLPGLPSARASGPCGAR